MAVSQRTAVPLSAVFFLRCEECATLSKEVHNMRCKIMFTVLTVAMFCVAGGAFGQTWNIQIVDDAGNTGYSSRVGATSDGTPYILYQNNSGYITLAWWVSTGGGSGGWDRTILSDYDLSHYVPALEVDANDDIHVAYSVTIGSLIKYGVFDHSSKTWSLSPEQVSDSHGNVSLALRDSLGTIIPVVAFSMASSPYRVMVAIRDPDSELWYEQTVYDDYQTSRPSIAVDSNGKLHLSFYEMVGDNLMYATNASGTWVSEYVDIAGDVGMYSAIVIDAGDVPYIVYYDNTNDDLKYAKLDNS
jgi:hypothetical protein